MKEYNVNKDPRTPPIIKEENPAATMSSIVSNIPSSKGINLIICSHGKYYSANVEGPNRKWNLNAFQLFYILYRMTVTDAPRTDIPSITIVK